MNRLPIAPLPPDRGQLPGSTSRERLSRRRRIAQRLLIAIGGLLVLDLLTSLIIPPLGYLQILIVSGLLNPPPPPRVAAYTKAEDVAYLNGRVYVGTFPGGTRVYDARSGALISTIAGQLVGSDSRYVYTSALDRSAFVAQSVPEAGVLTAWDGNGRAVWSHANVEIPLPRLPTIPQLDMPADGALRSDANNVYVIVSNSQTGTTAQNLVALDKATGATHWSYGPAFGFALARGTLVAIVSDEFVGLSASDGQVLWRQRKAVYTEQIITDGQAFYLLDTDSARALAAQTGARQWTVSYQWPATGTTPLLTDRDVTYLLTAAGAIVAVNTQNGRERWRSPPDAAPTYNLIAAQQGVLYIARQGLTAVDGATGRTLWTSSQPTGSWVRLVGIAGGTAYFATWSGCSTTSATLCTRIFAVNQRTGATLWTQETPLQSAGIAILGASISVVSSQQTQRFAGRSLFYGPPMVACSDTTTITTFAIVTGAVAWRQSTTHPCSGGL